MSYAPVLITTCNRVDHLQATLDSLRKCRLASKTDIIIGVDYPPNDTYRRGWNSILHYFKRSDFSDFHNLIVLQRDCNYGYFKNIRDLRSYAAERYETFITMQDDIEVSENFLVYMNAALEKYRNDPDVVAISGYSYPVNWRKKEIQSNSLRSNYVAAEWGIGYWKYKCQNIEDVLAQDYLYKEFPTAYKAGKLKKMTDAAIKDYSVSVLNIYYPDSWLRQVCDVSLRIYLAVADKYVIMPTLSHTRNHGFDGSGLFCGSVKKDDTGFGDYADNYDYDLQPLDRNPDYIFSPSSEDYCEENKELLNVFDRRDKNEMVAIKRQLKWYVIVGERHYHTYLVIKSYYCAVISKIKKIFR